MVLRIVNSSKQKPFLLFSLLVLLLAGCAQQTPQVTTPVATPEPDSELVPDESGKTARQWMDEARQLQGQRQQEALLQATTAALDEQNPRLALAISDELNRLDQPWLQAALPASQLQALLDLNQYNLAQKLIEQTEFSALESSTQPNFSYQAARLFHQLQQPQKAAHWLLRWDEITAPMTDAQPQWQQLWQLLSQLDEQQLQQLMVNAGPRTTAWLQLASGLRPVLGQPEQVQQQLQRWQQRYAQMPALEALPASILQLTELTPFQPARVAVLLPIHGNLRAHAQAIQNGLLAAATSQPDIELFFLDSQLEVQQLHNELTALTIDFVLGPLQRSRVDTIRQQSDWHWPTLFLNQPSQQEPLNPDQDAFFFSLSMEDEASQMAALFQRRNYQRPVLIHAQNPNAERMARHFSRQWRAYGHEAPESYSFQARDELEAMVARLLELEQSRQRLRQISQLIPGEVETDVHSRLDIDAVYLLADPTQTRLLKPFLDVSVSQTAPSLPVYASSRSHGIQADRTDHRDLAGLTFTEMPWMLTAQQGHELRRQFDQLFPDQDETLQRLFAMGFDALQLIPKLRQLQQIPALRHAGLTGELSLTPQGQIQRQLSWARYSQRALQAVQEP
ncbi:MAG: penicillin-binding protein activator [Alkalimonas sp.]|nr:penicillin-binding protein activator [Alkalimonas sp.]